MNLWRTLKFALRHGRGHWTLPLAHRILGHHEEEQYVAAYPRSGSTWFRTMLSNVLLPHAEGDL